MVVSLMQLVSCLVQLLSQPVNFQNPLILPFNRDILDLIGHGGIGQGLDGLLDVSVTRIQTSYHSSVVIPSETLFQQAGKLAISIGDVGIIIELFVSFGFNQRRYHLPQSEQAFVYLHRLFEMLP